MVVIRFVELATDLITQHPLRVMLGFFLLTAVFLTGLGQVETEAGTQQFAENIPAQTALEKIDRTFGSRFATDTGSTQLIQAERNVLSRAAMLRMLKAQQRLEKTTDLRVTSTSSAAGIVARELDPSARTLQQQIFVIEQATPTQLRRAVRRAAADHPRFSGLMSTDFNPTEAHASATIGVVQHQIPGGLSAGAGVGGSSPLTAIQLRAQHIIDSTQSNIRVFGTGIFSAEFSSVITDSLLIVVPAALVFVVFFLIIAYRDLLDLLLAVVALAMTIIWTFGFMGLVGIPFTQMLIAVPPLLLAVGIDFGIHAINRYREERDRGAEIAPAMEATGDQLIVAFFIVTGTTVIGFSANLSSQLGPIRDFGMVAAVGIVFTFLIFGIYLPASKVALDRAREGHSLLTMSETPLGASGTILGRLLDSGRLIANFAPRIFLVVILLGTVFSGYYALGVDTSFTQEDFLPSADTPDYLEELPEPFRPSQYSAIRDLNFLDDHFTESQSDTVTVYIEGNMERDHALASLKRAGRNPPNSFVRDGRHAETQGLIDVIHSQAAVDPSFNRLVARNDRDADGVPEDELERIYDYLLTSPAREQAKAYLSTDRRATRVVYSVKSAPSQAEITADARHVADRHRYFAVATGNTVVFQAISSLILESALVSLLIALTGTAIFLIFIYWVLTGWPSLGIANLVPIVVTVAAIAGSMRALGISFNAFTATILAITIGLGIDYSVHVTHRFIDEYQDRPAVPALRRTVLGTGGALTGSMLTTVFGIGVLVLAIFPAIGQFGQLTALSVLYSYLASIFVLPSVLMVWAGWAG